MDDNEVIAQIERLVAEEHRLRSHDPGEPPSADERERLQRLEVSLDQCWDLLRQRRAARSAGRDPDTAAVRDPETVESYEQ